MTNGVWYHVVLVRDTAVTKIYVSLGTFAAPAVLIADSRAGNGAGILLGGDGDDTLTSGNGRDISIGGAGQDTLNAGNGDDLLIAGRTSYDARTPANLATLLCALQKEWLRTDPAYQTQINHLTGTRPAG